MSAYHITIEDVNFERRHRIRILIGQLRSSESDWVQRSGLYFPSESANTANYLRQFLSQAETANVKLILLPELSVPADCVELLRAWSEKHEAVIIAGSHYKQYQNGYRNECPVLIAGETFIVDKIHPAHTELSPIISKGVKPGSQIKVFKNSPAGNFAVLICGDYFDAGMTDEVIKSVEDGIDLLCVPAFQRDSERYHPQMALDCKAAEHGLYIGYANMLCGTYADGRSALFAVMERQYLRKLEEEKLRKGGLDERIVDFGEAYDYGIFEIDLKHKRPYLGHTHLTHLNVQVVRVDRLSDEPTDSRTMDISSLKHFVRTNQIISRIDLAVRDKTGKTIVSADEFIATFVNRLRHVGIDTTDQLETALQQDEIVVTKSAVGWFECPRGQGTPLIPSGIAVSFLCVALIMRMDDPLPKLREFWRQNVFNPKEDIDRLTSLMADIYQAARAR